MNKTNHSISILLSFQTLWNNFYTDISNDDLYLLVSLYFYFQTHVVQLIKKSLIRGGLIS